MKREDMNAKFDAVKKRLGKTTGASPGKKPAPPGKVKVKPGKTTRITYEKKL